MMRYNVILLLLTRFKRSTLFISFILLVLGFCLSVFLNKLIFVWIGTECVGDEERK